jgi:hypothetical protein
MPVTRCLYLDEQIPEWPLIASVQLVMDSFNQHSRGQSLQQDIVQVAMNSCRLFSENSLTP